MLATTLLPTLLLALAVAANPIVVRNNFVTLPLSRRVNATSVVNVLRRDQARARALKTRASANFAQDLTKDAIIDEPVDNQVVSYVVRSPT